MHPFLFDWVVAGHHLKPPTYGVLLAVAFSAAYFDGLRRAIKIGEDPRHCENIFLIIVLSSVVGARMFHVVFEDPGYYLEHPGEIIAIWNGGYTLYGALLSAVFFGWLYTRRKKIDVLQYGDIAGPCIALGIGIGRLGCFFAGCCWGSPTDLPWGVKFTHPESFTLVRDKVVHPTQLYEAGLSFLLYAYLCWVFSRRQYRGQVFFQFFIGYAIIRFFVEFFRGDSYRGFVFGGALSYSQFISLAMLPFAVVAMFLYSRNKGNVD